MKKDSKIKNIKFVYDSSRVNEKNQVLPNIAYIYYDDGSCAVTGERNEIAKYKNDLLMQEGKPFKELLNSKAFLLDATSEKGVIAKADAEYKDALIKSKNLTDLNKKTLKRRIAAAITAVTVLAASLGLGLTACNKKDEKDSTSSSSYDDMDDLLALIKDELKKQNVKNMYDFINYSNNDLANKIAVSSDTNKYAYDLDTVIAMDLVFNNYSTKDLARMYDSKKFDVDSLNEKMKVCLSKLIPVMLRLNTNSNISNLFKDKEAKEFYQKYENKLIDINNASEKDSLIKSFFTMFRNDFKEYITEDGIGSNEEHSDKLMGAKVIVASSILPAVMILSPEKNGTLTNSEDKLLDNKLDSCGYIRKQLEKINNIKVNVLMDEEKNTYKVFTDEEGNVLDFDNSIEFNEIYEFIKKDLNLKDEMTTVGFITKDSEIVVSTGKGYASIGSSKTTTKTYSSLSDLEKAYGKNSKIVASAKAQKTEIDSKYKAQNEANRKKAEEEADKKASQIEKDSSAAADKKLQDIRDNAAVKDSSGNKKDDYSVVQDNNKDTANGDINIANDNFDGDIYDSNGNVIGKSNVKQNTIQPATTKPENTTVNTDDSKVYGEDDDPFDFNTGSGNNVVNSRSASITSLKSLRDELTSYSTNSNDNSYQFVK